MNRGYEVYLIDLPPNGRSSWLDHEMAGDIPYARISVEFVESELTASSKKSVGSWPTAADHSEWPGVSVFLGCHTQQLPLDGKGFTNTNGVCRLV